MKPTTVKLQLADMCYIYSNGEIENALRKIYKFIFLADFIIIDIEQDKEVQRIIGRPFLATARTLIDALAGELIMKVNNKEVVFIIFKAKQYLEDTFDCFFIDLVQGATAKAHEDIYLLDPLEVTLTMND